MISLGRILWEDSKPEGALDSIFRQVIFRSLQSNKDLTAVVPRPTSCVDEPVCRLGFLRVTWHPASFQDCEVTNLVEGGHLLFLVQHRNDNND